MQIMGNSWIVLIESDWNLKFKRNELLTITNVVLIESDWNLKTPNGAFIFALFQY